MSGTLGACDGRASISPHSRQAPVGRDGIGRYLASEHVAGRLEKAIVDAKTE